MPAVTGLEIEPCAPDSEWGQEIDAVLKKGYQMDKELCHNSQSLEQTLASIA